MTTTEAAVSRRIAQSAALAVALVFAGSGGDLQAQTPIYEYTGSPGDYLGREVAGVGDLNGDGFDDVVVGAPYQGFIQVYSGRRGDLLFEIAGDPADPIGVFGWSVTGMGDLDGDGLPDLVVGDPSSDLVALNSGAVHAYSGRGRWLWSLHSPKSGDKFGGDVDCCGDVDGDGQDDVIVGATEFQLGVGYALVLSGSDGTPFLRLDGVEDGDQFGTCVVGIGDVDADRVPDLLATAPLQGDRGAAHVFSGATGALIREQLGAELYDLFGTAAAAIGDLDGDRIPDYCVSAKLQRHVDGGPRCGAVTVFSGASGAELLRLGGTHDDEYYGDSVAGAGDVNGDGIPDLIVGVLQAESSIAQEPGRIEIASGTGEVLYTWVIDADMALLGLSVAGVGDVNGDGYDDVAAGAPWWSSSPDSRDGKAFVLGGAEVLLDLRPGAAVGGDKVTLVLAGDPIQPFAMFATAVNGAPISVMLMVSSFDRDGAFENRVIIPGNLGSLDLTLQAFALNSQGKTAVSNEELFLLRR